MLKFIIIVLTILGFIVVGYGYVKDLIVFNKGICSRCNVPFLLLFDREAGIFMDACNPWDRSIIREYKCPKCNRFIQITYASVDKEFLEEKRKENAIYKQQIKEKRNAEAGRTTENYWD